MAPVTNGYAERGAKHHVAIFREPSGRVHTRAVSLLEAAQRLSRHSPIVDRMAVPGAEFVMSLAPGEAIILPNKNGEEDIWIIIGAWDSGQITLEHHTDAAHQTNTKPMASTLLKAGARKVSIDPIGRIRKASD